MGIPKLLLLTGLLFSFMHESQTQNITDLKGFKQGKWQKTNNGRLIYEGQFIDNLPQGVFKYYYEDGKLRSQLSYSNNGKIADAINFHPNGKKMAEGKYVETKKDGQWKYYNVLETLSAEEFYEKGSPVGVWKTYYDDGKLLEECTYVNGKKQGIVKQFFGDGTLKSEVSFTDGKLEGVARFLFPGGMPMLQGRFKDDLREGLWITYNENGDKVSEINYEAGNIMQEVYYDKAREIEAKEDVKEIQE